MQLLDLISKLPSIAERLDLMTSTIRPRQLPTFRADLPAAALTSREGC
jgi:hypothetical protein